MQPFFFWSEEFLLNRSDFTQYSSFPALKKRNYRVGPTLYTSDLSVTNDSWSIWSMLTLTYQVF